jgi:ATP-binding cassette subfamily F protein uup
MSLLLSVNKLQKQMGSKILFEDLSFGIHEREKIGLIGPNGSGKSTLLRILSGEEDPGDGTISRRKGLKLSFVQQEEVFDESLSVLEAAVSQLLDRGMSEDEVHVYGPMYLSIAGFEDSEQKVEKLSGGRRKRLNIAIALAEEPELLILDEPTNHMDWDGILWLESNLQSFKGSFLIVSHDRELLDRLCKKTMELNRLYENGFLSFECAYTQFLGKKEAYIKSQIQLQSSMSNKARKEVEWLRAGVKARTTKSQSRIKEAHKLLDDLEEVTSRNQASRARIRLELDSSNRLSKKLIELKDLSISYGEHRLVNRLNLLLGPKTCLGILGSNGSGKSSLLKVIAGIADNFTGQLFRADDLRVVYFDQKREKLPQDEGLLEYLGNGTDRVIFREQAVSVASYASRLLFPPEKMKLKISHLSGGEQARLLLGKLLLQPADVLILDEPTNDLDIDSIEVLEETLQSFPGLVILVSHDRYFLSRLCGKFLALESAEAWSIYADLDQWLKARPFEAAQPEARPPKKEIEKKPLKGRKKKSKVKLSYMEKRKMETLEEDIETAERELAAAVARLESPGASSDPMGLNECVQVVEQKQKRVDELYAFWESVEEKLK